MLRPSASSRDEGDPLGLRLLRKFRLARTVEGDRLANQRLEGGLVHSFSFVDVDRAAYVSVETRVEETGRILQRRALGEGKLHDILVGFASTDDAVVRPNRSTHPLPLLDDVRVCFLDELAHSAEGFAAPVPEFGDSFRDELRCRLALARARLFHRVSARKPLTSVRGGIALQSCPSRVSLSTHGGTAEYRGIVGASRPVVEVRHRTLTRSARSNNRCSPTRK